MSNIDVLKYSDLDNRTSKVISDNITVRYNTKSGNYGNLMPKVKRSESLLCPVCKKREIKAKSIDSEGKVTFYRFCEKCAPKLENMIIETPSKLWRSKLKNGKDKLTTTQIAKVLVSWHNNGTELFPTLDRHKYDMAQIAHQIGYNNERTRSTLVKETFNTQVSNLTKAIKALPLLERQSIRVAYCVSYASPKADRPDVFQTILAVLYSKLADCVDFPKSPLNYSAQSLKSGNCTVRNPQSIVYQFKIARNTLKTWYRNRRVRNHYNIAYTSQIREGKPIVERVYEDTKDILDLSLEEYSKLIDSVGTTANERERLLADWHIHHARIAGQEAKEADQKPTRDKRLKYTTIDRHCVDIVNFEASSLFNIAIKETLAKLPQKYVALVLKQVHGEKLTQVERNLKAKLKKDNESLFTALYESFKD